MAFTARRQGADELVVNGWGNAVHLRRRLPAVVQNSNRTQVNAPRAAGTVPGLEEPKVDLASVR